MPGFDLPPYCVPADAEAPLYVGLHRRGVTLPPFPTANWPELVFAVTGPCGPSASQSTSIVKCVLQPLARLVLATCHWSPDEHALPVRAAPMIHFAIVPATHDIAEIEEDPHGPPMVFGEDELLMRASDASARFAIVFSPAHCDPHRSPLPWSRVLPDSDDDSCIGYAFS